MGSSYKDLNLVQPLTPKIGKWEYCVDRAIISGILRTIKSKKEFSVCRFCKFIVNLLPITRKKNSKLALPIYIRSAFFHASAEKIILFFWFVINFFNECKLLFSVYKYWTKAFVSSLRDSFLHEKKSTMQAISSLIIYVTYVVIYQFAWTMKPFCVERRGKCR